MSKPETVAIAQVDVPSFGEGFLRRQICFSATLG